jgi:hypothetical protein
LPKPFSKASRFSLVLRMASIHCNENPAKVAGALASCRRVG